MRGWRGSRGLRRVCVLRLGQVLEESCTLTCTVDREDAWLFEATRALLEQLGVQGADAQVEALLAEGQGTLLPVLPADALDLDRWEGVNAAQHRWLEELGRWRAAAEALCEKNFRGSVLRRSHMIRQPVKSMPRV